MSFNFGGTAAAPAAGAGFGGFGAAAKPTGVATPFGAAATTTTAAAAPAFGGFGAAAAKPTAAAAPTLGGFGAAATATPATSAAPGFGGFGAGAAPATSAAPAFGGVGGFGAAASTTRPAAGLGGFGVAATAAAATTAPTLSLGGFGAAATSSAAPTLGGFGAPAAASTAPTLGLGGTATTAASLGFGLGGTAATSTAISSAPSVVGLGGKAGQNPLTLGQGGDPSKQTSTSSAPTDPKNLKENQIPNELAQTVEEFKKFVKEERGVSSDIAHISSKAHQKIKSDTEGLLNLVKSLSAGLAKNRAQLDALKLDAAQELLNVEIAQRTKDTPPALQYENVAPYEYFSRLISGFEHQMLLYRRQIEETEQHLQTMASQQALSPDDITKAIEKLHGTFTNLAARFQKLHELCQQQKETYVHLHRVKYGKDTDLFDKTPVALSATRGITAKANPTMLGPSPFTGQQDLLALAKASLSARGPQQQQQSMLGGPPPTYGLGTTPGTVGQNTSIFGGGGTTSMPQQGLYGTTMSPFGASGASTSFGQNTSLFQTAGKRGKH